MKFDSKKAAARKMAERLRQEENLQVKSYSVELINLIHIVIYCRLLRLLLEEHGKADKSLICRAMAH